MGQTERKEMKHERKRISKGHNNSVHILSTQHKARIVQSSKVTVYQLDNQGSTVERGTQFSLFRYRRPTAAFNLPLITTRGPFPRAEMAKA